MVFGASAAHLFQKFQDGDLGNASHSHDGIDGRAFNQGRYYSGALVSGELVHDESSLYLLGQVVKENIYPSKYLDNVCPSKYSDRMTDDRKPDQSPSDAAKELARLGASKGGEARAQKLSPERRREIARKAIDARWAKAGKTPLPTAKYLGELKIGDMVIPAAVLDDGTRVISERGMAKAIGSKRGGSHWQRKKKAEEEGGAFLPVFLSASNLKPFIPKDLALALSRPILYRVPGSGGVANGIEANSFPKICRVWLDAKIAGALSKPQERIATAADILLRGLEEIGIVGLVDEATGYQETRAKDALAKILEAFIAKELRGWISTFPADYYKEMFRLRGWNFPELPEDQRRRPVLVGKITNDVVYDRLAPGVREELHRLTPRNEKGRLKHKLFQRLTKETGHPKLKEHLQSLVVLMRAADDWPQFMRMLNRSLPRYGDTPYLPFEG